MSSSRATNKIYYCYPENIVFYGGFRKENCFCYSIYFYTLVNMLLVMLITLIYDVNVIN